MQLDLQTFSILIAAMSVVVGVIMSILSLRNFTKSRQASVFLEFHKQVDKEFLEDMSEIIVQWDWTSYSDFRAKYGPRTNPSAYAKFLYIGSFFNSMGTLLLTKVTDVRLVPETLAVLAMSWYEKIESIGEEMVSGWRTSESMDSSRFLYDTLKQLGYQSPVPRGRDGSSPNEVQ
ncbi:MAG: hypothetical protein JSW05_08135 [Candidatus Thorarchaeota archaeon]|nr:MAG: hypothetical protein JSW05_08135 [Candidatus Thorarchaeota archaeon]